MYLLQLQPHPTKLAMTFAGQTRQVSRALVPCVRNHALLMFAGTVLRGVYGLSQSPTAHIQHYSSAALQQCTWQMALS